MYSKCLQLIGYPAFRCWPYCSNGSGLFLAVGHVGEGAPAAADGFFCPCYLPVLCTCSWDYSGVTPYQLQELGVSSVQELQAARDARQAARKALADFLARKDVSGPEKHRARCAFIHKHLRLPYQCTGCWLLPGNCVCNKLRTAKPKTKVVIHLHQDEWGRGEVMPTVYCIGSDAGGGQEHG